jgi:hypothetical protein
MMRLSKKRKIAATVDQQNETTVEEARPVVDTAESQETVASDQPQQKASTEKENTSAVQNDERQARFKALQARAVCPISFLLCSHGYAHPRLKPDLKCWLISRSEEIRST